MVLRRILVRFINQKMLTLTWSIYPVARVKSNVTVVQQQHSAQVERLLFWPLIFRFIVVFDVAFLTRKFACQAEKRFTLFPWLGHAHTVIHQTLFISSSCLKEPQIMSCRNCWKSSLSEAMPSNFQNTVRKMQLRSVKLSILESLGLGGQEVPSFQCRQCGYGFNLDWTATCLETVFNVTSSGDDKSVQSLNNINVWQERQQHAQGRYSAVEFKLSAWLVLYL